MVFMRENWRRFSLIEGMEESEEGRSIGDTAEKMVENTMEKVILFFCPTSHSFSGNSFSRFSSFCATRYSV